MIKNKCDTGCEMFAQLNVKKKANLILKDNRILPISLRSFFSANNGEKGENVKNGENNG
jgi:hypothetical protein